MRGYGTGDNGRGWGGCVQGGRVPGCLGPRPVQRGKPVATTAIVKTTVTKTLMRIGEPSGQV